MVVVCGAVYGFETNDTFRIFSYTYAQFDTSLDVEDSMRTFIMRVTRR